MSDKKQTAHPSDNVATLPWWKQTHFLIAMIVIALLIGSHFGPNDSNASVVPSPTIEATLPTPAPQPIASMPVIEINTPAPAPSAPVTVVNVLANDKQDTPSILRELQPVVLKHSAPEPEPSPVAEEPKTEPMARSSADERCQKLLKEHQRRVAAIQQQMANYHP